MWEVISLGFLALLSPRISYIPTKMNAQIGGDMAEMNKTAIKNTFSLDHLFLFLQQSLY